MKRKIIKIDEEKCNGCGLCAEACHEGAISMVDGKAKLMRDDYCDGLGNCLPVCPTGAITFEEREAAEYDEAAVRENMEKKTGETLPCGCPSTHVKTFDSKTGAKPIETPAYSNESMLKQWPIQIKLLPVKAPFFENANLLVSADCCSYAYGDFHRKFMQNRITIIGCPKLDDGDYSEKLTTILKMNNIKSVTVVRMEVPCCGGIEHAVKTALKDSGKMIPWQSIIISTDGEILE